VNGTGGGTPLTYAQVRLVNPINVSNSSAPNFGLQQVTFDAVDYDPSVMFRAQSSSFTLQANKVWEIGATVTTFSWSSISILHIIDLTNNRSIKSIVANPNTDYDESFSIDCIFRTTDPIDIAIYMESNSQAWDILGNDYSAALGSKNPNFSPNSLTYFWIHQIA